MKILKQGNLQANDKRTIYISVDDVILNISQAVTDLLNKWRTENGLNPIPRDVGFKSLKYEQYYKGLSDEYPTINELFNSIEYAPLIYTEAKFNEKLIEGLTVNDEKLFKAFNWVIVSNGSGLSHGWKRELIFHMPDKVKNNIWHKHNNEIGYYALDEKENKRCVHMFDGIQIDSNYTHLKDTDAELKILLKSGAELGVNTIHKTRDNLDNLYIMDNTEQLIETLKFIADTGDEFFNGLNYDENNIKMESY